MDEQAIQNLRAASNQAFAAHDYEKIGSMLCDDFTISLSTGEVVKGKEAYIAGLAKRMARSPDFLYVRTPQTIAADCLFNSAIEQGMWEGQKNTPKGLYKSGGKYTAHWHKIDGNWKIFSEEFVALFSSH